MARMRLNRFLAQCGVASRRNAEKLIGGGRVRVNGTIRRLPATAVDSEFDRIEVDGKPVRLPSGLHYLLLNKPAGYDVTKRDPFAKRVVYELLPPDTPASVQAVGRLDRDTTGLLLLTNDGELAFRLTHPRFEIEKEYLAFGEARPTKAQIARLLRGIALEDGPARADRVEPVTVEEARRLGLGRMPHDGLRIVIHQGRKRIVRRLCAAVDLPLIALHRTRVGAIELGSLQPGALMEMNAKEAAALRTRVGLPATPAAQAPEPDADA